MKLTKFNPQNKELLTFGECLEPAMEITEQEDADQYLKAYIEYTKKCMENDPRDDDKPAEWIVKQNLGYFAGYYSNETRARVEKLFKCSHPIFGSIKEKGAPTNEEAYEAGKRYVERNKK